MQERDSKPPRGSDGIEVGALGSEGSRAAHDGSVLALPESELQPESPQRTETENYATRFAWPLRLFLFAFVVDMGARSLVTLTPYDGAWRTDLGMERFPLPFPTARERLKIENGKDPIYETVAERYSKTAASVVDYVKPWPDADVRERMHGAADVGKFATVWVGTRLNFVGALTGVDQNWPMFAPNVRTTRLIPRAKLIFADGSNKQLWLLGEPWDLTSFSRWFVKRPLQIDIRLHQDFDARLGVSRHLARVHPVSDTGSPLRYIEFHKVFYRLPKPGQDAYDVLRRQSRKPLGDDPFWRYDVQSERGRTLQDEWDKKKAERDRQRRKERRAAAEADTERAEEGEP